MYSGRALQIELLKKGKIHIITHNRGTAVDEKYSSTLSLTSTVDGGGWLTPRPGRFTPEKETRYSLCRRLGGPQGRCGRVPKIFFTRNRSPDLPARSESLYFRE